MNNHNNEHNKHDINHKNQIQNSHRSQHRILQITLSQPLQYIYTTLDKVVGCESS